MKPNRRSNGIAGDGAEDCRRPAGARRRERPKQAASSRLRVLREMERDYAGYQQAVKQVCCTRAGTRAFAAWWRR
ncbi:MAG: hypothetical protein ACLS6G_10540 [Christensenellales bacterium]